MTRCLGLPLPEDADAYIAKNLQTEPDPEPEYVKQLREDIADLKDRVRSLEESNRFYHGGNSDDE